MSFDEQTNKQTIMLNNCSVLFTHGEKKNLTKEHCKHGRMQRHKQESRKSCVFLLFDSSQVNFSYICVVWPCTTRNLFTCNFFLHLSFTVCVSLFYNFILVSAINRRTWMNFYSKFVCLLEVFVFDAILRKMYDCIWIFRNVQGN